MPAQRVIVVGASAGGLEALMRIVRDLPGDLPAAVLIVLHTAPRAESRLAEILGKLTAMPVRAVVRRMALESGAVYVATPNRHLVLRDGHAEPSAAPPENRNRPSVDVLFRSAAAAYGRRAVGVVLSGMLDDGSAGLAAIVAQGGAAVVQSPEDAAFPSMPANALVHVAADHVLAAGEIGAVLGRLVLAGSDAEQQREIDRETS